MQVIHADRAKQGTLTLPDVSSTSDKGQTDSQTAQVHTAQPAAKTTAPFVPSSAAQNKSLDTDPYVTHAQHR